jgi:hypothetical protein
MNGVGRPGIAIRWRLHLSLAARFGLSDWLRLTTAWRWAGVADELAVVGFVACAAALAVRAVVVR